jgi:hypothetical protein
VIDWVVAPVDQVFAVAALEVNVTLPPEQKVKGPLAEIVGAEGVELTVTIVGVDVTEQAPELTETVYEPAVGTVID